jgi:hypothetical protein
MKNREQGSATPASKNRSPGTPAGIRDQKSWRLAQLLREALPPIVDTASEKRDLWPVMQRRLRVESAPASAKVPVPWFDWALAGGLAMLLAAFPAWIPVLLYYL